MTNAYSLIDYALWWLFGPRLAPFEMDDGGLRFTVYENDPSLYEIESRGDTYRVAIHSWAGDWIDTVTIIPPEHGHRDHCCAYLAVKRYGTKMVWNITNVTKQRFIGTVYPFDGKRRELT